MLWFIRRTVRAWSLKNWYSTDRLIPQPDNERGGDDVGSEPSLSANSLDYLNGPHDQQQPRVSFSQPHPFHAPDKLPLAVPAVFYLDSTSGAKQVAQASTDLAQENGTQPQTSPDVGDANKGFGVQNSSEKSLEKGDGVSVATVPVAKFQRIQNWLDGLPDCPFGFEFKAKSFPESIYWDALRNDDAPQAG